MKEYFCWKVQLNEVLFGTEKVLKLPKIGHFMYDAKTL